MSWLSAEAALERLGTKPQTLYANVSRGRIAARPDPDDPRRSLYRQDDVERLAARQRGRRPAQAVAAESIAWGEPVLATAISTVRDGRLLYRGKDAVALAETATLEGVAGLLWGEAPQTETNGSGHFHSISSTFAFGDNLDDPHPPSLPSRGREAIEPEVHDIQRAYGDIARLAATDMPSAGRSRAVLLADASRVVGVLAGALTTPGADLAHARLAQQWERPEAAECLRVALVLLAEHELNASTFAARVTASTGAPLSASVLAGLAALSGPLHGNASQSMAGLVAMARQDGAEAAVREYLRQGRPLPCFGHRLYATGDVRAAALMGWFALPPLFAELAKTGTAMSGEEPNIDFALAALTAAFDLPADAPLQIFALARSVGWIAHALEQVETGALIRPRARYAGV